MKSLWLKLRFFGFCITGAALILPMAQAQTYTESTLYNFCSQANCADGYNPGVSLIQGADGNLYGGTDFGGTDLLGTTFKLSPSGTLTTLTEEGEGSDSLVQGGDGEYYFTQGHSIVKMSSSGNLSVLESATNASNLIQGSDGNFYGLSFYNNLNTSQCPYVGSCGTIIKVTPSGEVSVVYQFCSLANCEDGQIGAGPLVEGSDGNLYGTTSEGGANTYYGTVFKISKSGTYTQLFSFDSSAYGAPSLVEGPDGNFYGLNEQGSGPCLLGCAFNISPSGTYHYIVGFCSYYDTNICNYAVLSSPVGGFFLASNGLFYASSFNGPGGINVFSMTSTGSLNIVYPYFAAPPTITQGSDGNFYGVEEDNGVPCGNYGCGAAYKITATPALPAPVQISLSSSTVSPGASVTATFQVLNAFSLTMQQCYAFSTYNGGAMSPLGKVTGTLTNNIYTGSATFTAGAQGTYNFALTCGGIESGFATLTVAGTPTTTAIVANPNPPTVGQQVTLTAQVRRTSGGGFATGAVKFQSGSTLLGTSTLNGSGVATFTASTNGLPPGSYPVTATYEGDSADAASTSPSLPVTLGQAPTSVTLLANPTSVTPPANVALSATVTRSASGATGTPTGTVTFSSGTVTLATVNVNGSGVAAYTASSSGVPAGEYPVTAKYNGDASDTSSTSAAVDVTVK